MSRHIFLFDIVDSFSAKDIISQLLKLNRESTEEITMFINTPGGEVQSMFAIIDTMNLVESPIRTVVMGQAASAGAVIASAGKTRLMTEKSRFMIHELITGMFGSLSQIKERVIEAEKQHLKALSIISKATGKTVEQIDKAIKKTDKFLTAKESKSFGLVHDVIKNDSATVINLSEHLTGHGFEIPEYQGTIGTREVQLLLEGKYEHPVFGTLNITEATLHKFKENFDNNVRGIEISIDYTHDNEEGEKPAACWIKDLSIRSTDKGMGLFASSEFTPKGLKLIQEKEYKYASADFAINYVTDKGECVPYVLCGGTLTNRPFIKEMNPIKLSETKSKEKKHMSVDTLKAELKNDFGVDVDGITESNESLKSEIETLNTKIKELSSLPVEKDGEIANLKGEVDKLNSKINDGEKVKIFDSLMAEGKVTPAQKDSILSLFDSAEKISEFYKDAPKVVNMKKDGDGSQPNTNLTDAEQRLCDAGEYTEEELIKNRK